MECNQILSFHPNEEAEEVDEEQDVWVEEYMNINKPAYCNRNNQMKKIFHQKCVLCFENHKVYAFCQCGHQCICEECWTNSNVEMFECVVFRNSFFLTILFLRL